MAYDKAKFVEECNRRREEGLVVKGKTFDVKDYIKQLGGIWDSMNKQWLMPDKDSVDNVLEEMGVAKSDDQPTQGESPTETPEMPF